MSFHETGNSVREYFEISHGRFYATKLGIPPENWSYFDRVTRLPSRSLAWLVEVGAWSALVTEKKGNPVVETLWRSEDDDRIVAISATRWHIPDYARIQRFPEEIYRGGRVFDGVTLTQYPLPNQPTDRIGRFVALSPDDVAVAWFHSFYTTINMDTRNNLLWVSDARGATGPPLTLSESFVSRNPPPDARTQSPSLKTWLDQNFYWRLDEARRWRVSFNSEQSAA